MERDDLTFKYFNTFSQVRTGLWMETKDAFILLKIS